MYAPLWCKSNFSFLEGASHPAELIETAHHLGLPALALTDRDGVHGIVKAWSQTKDTPVKLLVGSQITVEDGSHLVLLAQDRPGYAQLCQLISAGRLRSEKGESVVGWDDVCRFAPGLLALWGGDGSLIAGLRNPDAVARDLTDAFGDRLYALLTRHRLAEEVDREARVRERAVRYGLPLVAGQEVLYHTPERRQLQDILTCIRHGTTLHEAGRRLRANTEYALKSSQAFAALYADDPEAVARTLEVAARCPFALNDLRYVYPSERLPDGTTTHGYLRDLVEVGAVRRFGTEVPATTRSQLEKELRLIEKLDYGGYFLTMYEIVQYCERAGILCQGRGSSANSLVCYCLGITAVGPDRIDLLFERFLSEERAEPPDIDLDIEHERREEVIQHVYEKYGRSHAAMVAVVITYRTKSAIRDVGKALGMPETELDRFSKLFARYEKLQPESLKQAGFDPEAPLHRHLLRLALAIKGFPRHLSIHPGGFLLGHDPVATLVPIENGTKEGRTVIQWDKDDVEALGLFKVDLLGLGALHQLRRCFDLLQTHRGEVWSMATIPADDEATYDMICRGDTVGVFQIESRAQMSMLPRLRPRNYYDLVIQIAIVRPGPITGGMVHPYLRRRNGEEPVEFPHPSLAPVLEKTKGVPLFQEQVMKLAVVAADYTEGEADQLRRDMAAWKLKGDMSRHEEKLISRMMAKGIEEDFARRVFEQIKGFGEYGFPEAHSASFALIAYATAWLKCHYPAEFACSLLNAMPMGFYSPATIVEEARRHGVTVRPIDIRYSQWDCSMEPDGGSWALRMGLRYVNGLGEGDGRIIAETLAEGPFDAVDDVIGRTGLDEGALVALAEAGAFEGLGASRRQALWRIRGMVRSESVPLPVDIEVNPDFAPLTLFERINWDYQRTDHSALGHPLSPLREQLRAQGLPDAREVTQKQDGEWVRYVGTVINRQRPGTASGVVFMTLEDETGFVNLVVWPKVFKRFSLLATTRNFLGVSGTLQVKDGVVHLIVQRFWLPTGLQQPQTLGSRDFQ